MANITGQDQTVEFTVRPDALDLPDAARLVRTWPPEPESLGEAAGDHDLTLPARTAAVYVITTDVDRAMQVNPLDDTPWEMQVVEDGPFAPVTGPAGSLWACSDGPVVNLTGDASTSATPYYYDKSGALAPRVGHQAEPHGMKAEGKPLPRDLDAQPFALLRQLPHSVTPGEGVLVLSGDAYHLSCVAPAGAEITFAAPGLVIVSSPDTGQIFHELTEDPTASVTMPDAEGSYLVGYARFEPTEIDALLAAGDPDIVGRIRPLAGRLLSLADAAPDSRVAELAAASRDFVDIASGFGSDPGALSPVAALPRLHERVEALTVAQLSGQMQVTARHRWLSPGIIKYLTVMLHNEAGLFDELTGVEIVPVGGWAEGGLAVNDESANWRVPKASRAYHPSLMLHDGLYVERMIPVIVCARVTRGGEEFCLSEIFRLQANRPYEIKPQVQPVTVVAGASGQATIKLRNWSPEDVHVTFAGSGPRGWQVQPDPIELTATGLQYSQLTVQVTPPENVGRGSYEVQLAANHTGDEDKVVFGTIAVSVLDALRPVSTDGAWKPSEADEPATIRRAGTMALYAEQGEQIRVRMDNVRVTRYVDTLSYELHAPDMSMLQEGQVKVDEAHEIEVEAPVTGTYYLWVRPKQGSVVVTTENRYFGEVATAEAPLNLYNSDITRYFYVPEDSTEFAILGRDGGPTETARVAITSPTGRIAYEHDGNYSGAENLVQVMADEAGKVWTIRVEPVQDLDLWLSGGVSACMATAPERVLAPVGR